MTPLRKQRYQLCYYDLYIGFHPWFLTHNSHSPYYSKQKLSLSDLLLPPFTCPLQNSNVIVGHKTFTPKSALSCMLGKGILHRSQKLSGQGLDAVVHACNPSTLGGCGGRIARAQEFKTSLGKMSRPHLYEK